MLISSTALLILQYVSFHLLEFHFIIDASPRTGKAIQATTLLVRSGEGTTRQRPQADVDAGEDLVPESQIQKQTAAHIGGRGAPGGCYKGHRGQRPSASATAAAQEDRSARAGEGWQTHAVAGHVPARGEGGGRAALPGSRTHALRRPGDAPRRLRAPRGLLCTLRSATSAASLVISHYRTHVGHSLMLISTLTT